MGKWSFSKASTPGGQFRLVITKLVSKPGVDVTRFRNAPVQISSFSNSDPFGDSTAVFSFPQITPFDDLQSQEIGSWLADYSNVDLYWLPAVDPASGLYTYETPVRNPLTNKFDIITPVILRDGSGNPTGTNQVKVWEGYIASFDFRQDSAGGSLEVQCQGALFQADRYLMKPFYPAQPWPLEALIGQVFDRKTKPHLRTQPLIIQWPTGWKKIAPPYSKYVGGSGGTNVYTPVVTPGSKWTGFTSRSTGSWDRALTGFAQDQLAVMLTTQDSGVTPGNQWTVQHFRAGGGTVPVNVVNNTGRQPVLMVRDRFRTPDFDVWMGAPGVTVNLTHDSTQAGNIIFGDGTDINGQVWRNAVINFDGSRTDYLPLAASSVIYPYTGNPSFDPNAFASEIYFKYGPGFSQKDATDSAKQTLNRDQDAGWSGSITLTLDPSVSISKWLIRAGMTVRLCGFLGTGATGFPLHVSAVEASPMDGSVTLTVDSLYRDLLNLQEALQRTRDALTPTRMLQINRQSVLIEDIQAPWDYSAGSGFIPKASTDFYRYKPTATVFPYTDWSTKHPPLHYPSWYVKCRAAAPASRDRWTAAVPILTSERFTIQRSEFYVTDLFGRILKIPFHVSLYGVNVTVDAMPRDGTDFSAWRNNAFESIDPATGQAWPAGSFNPPDGSFIIGWGNRANGIYNRAGFSPGSEAEGGKPTGMLFDDSTWSWDNTSNPNYDKYLKPGKREPSSAITIYAMFYCEYNQNVYFQGRLYRQNPGVS